MASNSMDLCSACTMYHSGVFSLPQTLKWTIQGYSKGARFAGSSPALRLAPCLLALPFEGQQSHRTSSPCHGISPTKQRWLALGLGATRLPFKFVFPSGKGWTSHQPPGFWTSRRLPSNLSSRATWRSSRLTGAD